jgi:cell division GTPase FtsZ
VDPDANIIFGVVFDPKMDSEVRITVIATGFAKTPGGAIRSADELRRLIKGGSDALDMPSFMRRANRFPTSRLENKPKVAAPVTLEPTRISRQ